MRLRQIGKRYLGTVAYTNKSGTFHFDYEGVGFAVDIN